MANAPEPAETSATPAPEPFDLYERFERCNTIDPRNYERANVKRGLRNSDGTGVMAGVTRISNVHGYIVNEGDQQPCEGELTLRGFNTTASATKSSSTCYLPAYCPPHQTWRDSRPSWTPNATCLKTS